MPKISKLPSNKKSHWNWKNVVTPKKSVPKSKRGNLGNKKTYIESLGLTPVSTPSAVVGGRRKTN